MPTPQFIYGRGDFERLRDSVRAFGFGYLPDSIVPDVLSTLQAEADERFGSSLTAEQASELCYRANITSLGTKAAEFFRCTQAIELLEGVFDEDFELTGDMSCLTYYKEGDHLGAHRDQPAQDCAVTVIAYLAALSPSPFSPNTGLELLVYGEDMPKDGTPRLRIPTEAGTIVVGRGSKIWHERRRLGRGESVSALTGCYKPIA